MATARGSLVRSSNRHHRAFKQRAFGIAGNQPIPCFWCDSPLYYRDATVEHIVARSLGGDNSPANLVIACLPCNQTKAEIEAILAAERRRERIAATIADRLSDGHAADRLRQRLRILLRFLKPRRHRLPEAQAHYEFCLRVLSARCGVNGSV